MKNISTYLGPCPCLLRSLPLAPIRLPQERTTHSPCLKSSPLPVCVHFFSSPHFTLFQPKSPPSYSSNPPDVPSLRAFALAVSPIWLTLTPSPSTVHISSTHHLQEAFLDSLTNLRFSVTTGTCISSISLFTAVTLHVAN